MRIRSLSLYNFRNFSGSHEIEFPSSNLLIAAAPNATGKTNFLESIAVLLRGKSFRAQNDECVEWGKDMFLVQGVLDYYDQQARLAVQYHVPSRRLRIEENSAPVSPITFYSHYPFILFLPEDTFLFHRGPAARRNFLNTTLVSSSQYLSAVVQYHRALRQRNAALKKAASVGDIAPWTELLARHAAGVWSHRQLFIQYLQSHLSSLYQELFQEAYTFEVSLITGASNPESFGELLREAWPYEEKYRYTLYGPHRDDIQVLVDGRPMTTVLSRGQIRSAVVAMKAAAFGFVQKRTGQTPLILFDEVLSELDEGRQEALLYHLPAAQVLLTCTTVPPSIKKKSDVHMLDLERIMSSVKDHSVLPEPHEAAGEETPAADIEVRAEAEEEHVAVRS